MCCVERRVTSVKNEQDDADGKQVDFLPSILLFQKQFWCHVGRRSQNGLQKARSVPSLGGCSKAKVCKANIVLAVHHNIFWLQITVRHALRVHVVQHLHHLLEVVAAHFRAKPLQGHKVKKLAARDQLESHVGNLNILSTRALPNRIRFEFNHSDHVRVVKPLINRDFLPEGVHCFLVVVGIRLIKDL